MSSQRYSADHWRSWFEEFDRIGLTVEHFCRLKGSTANTFYLWRKKLGLASVRSSRLRPVPTEPTEPKANGRDKRRLLPQRPWLTMSAPTSQAMLNLRCPVKLKSS
jgi:hypothetical protein